MKCIAFDIETHKITPEGTKVLDCRPLGISCAATYKQDRSTLLWCHNFVSADPMTQEEAGHLVAYLQEAVKNRYTILTWNGNFDFLILAEESGMWNECRELAEQSMDMMYHVFCVKGYPLGLQAACLGLGVTGKTEGMHGDLAPVMWQRDTMSRLLVLEYVADDVLATMRVAEKSIQQGEIQWQSKQLRWQSVELPFGWLTVKEAKDIPLPDTSWMSNPLKREEFYSW